MSPTRKRPRGEKVSQRGGKRARVEMKVPALPVDVWHCVVGMLQVEELGELAQVSRMLGGVCDEALQNVLWGVLGGVGKMGEGVGEEVRMIGQAVVLLDETPSLRHKRVAKQVRMVGREGGEEVGDARMCFTMEQARVFLGVDEEVLRERFVPVTVKMMTRQRGRKGRVAPLSAFAMFPPDPSVVRRESLPVVFGIRTVLRAAWECQGGGEGVLRVVEKAVREDRERFERAKRAERVIEDVVGGKGVAKREVEYVLAASAEVVEFRRGFWKRSLDGYSGLVEEMVEVHVRLGGCYKCLLICDGNARLKAKRIVGKILKRETGFDVGGVVRELEGNLWWARSKSNVQKMEEMSRQMPHIRV